MGLQAGGLLGDGLGEGGTGAAVRRRWAGYACSVLRLAAPAAGSRQLKVDVQWFVSADGDRNPHSNYDYPTWRNAYPGAHGSVIRLAEPVHRLATPPRDTRSDNCRTVTVRLGHMRADE